MSLKDKEVGVFVENNYQELEFWYPYYRLKEAGCKVTVIAPEKIIYKSKLGYEAMGDMTAENAMHQKFDALIIPGGYAPDLMRSHEPMLKLIRDTHTQGGIIAAICHAPWVLISARILSGKSATCYHTIKDDLINAGAKYLDQSVVIDDNIITSRKPDDLPDFCKKIIEKLQ